MTTSKKYWRSLEQYEEKRFQDLLYIYKKANQKDYNNDIINKSTKETLQDIACSKSRYEQLMKFYDNEVKKKREKQDQEKENEDMSEAEKIYNEAFELMKSRNLKYWDSWRVLSIQSIANLCEMKLHRISNLDKLEPKIYDELIDTLNYMVFALLKLNNK